MMAEAQAEAIRAAIEFSRTVTALAPPNTLGGGTATRTPVGQNILTKLRKDLRAAPAGGRPGGAEACALLLLPDGPAVVGVDYLGAATLLGPVHRGDQFGSRTSSRSPTRSGNSSRISRGSEIARGSQG